MISAGGVAGAGYYAGGGSDEGRSKETPNYYTGATAKGEPPGQWHGRFAEKLGLTGPVTGQAMEAVFDRFQTPDGQSIGKRSTAAVYQDRAIEMQGRIDRLEDLRDRLASRLDRGSVDSIARASIEDRLAALPEEIDALRIELNKGPTASCHGLDLTFSPAKSVTVYHTAAWRAELKAASEGDTARAEKFGAIRESLEEALFEANEAAMEYASTLTTTRVGSSDKGTITWLPAPDLVRASFFQHTSRANDPQLHIHNPILNRTLGEDGVVRALDTRDLMQQRGAVSAVGDRALAELLADRGLAMAVRPDGVAREIVGYDPAVSELFSQRRTAITKAMGPAVERAQERLGRGLNPFELDQLARTLTIVTRDGKSEAELDPDALLDQWETRLMDELGRGLAPLAERIAVAFEGGPVERSSEFSMQAVGAEAVQRCAAKRATWTRAELMREVDLLMPLTGLPVREVTRLLEDVTDEALRMPGVQQIGGRAGILPPRDLVAGSYVRPSSVTYAAPVTLQAEDMIRQAAVERGCHSVDAKAVNAWLDANPQYRTIGADQRAAVVGIASSDAALTMIVGPAGTGKSFAAGALAGAWAELTDGKVHGLTVSQYAAGILRDDGVVSSANIAAWLSSQDRLEAGRPLPQDLGRAVGPRDTILVDEASMVGTAQLDRIRDIARSIGAPVVLMGDPRQLGAVEAGGAMGLLVDRAETHMLVETRRFSQEWEGKASLALRDRSEDAFSEYERHGRLVEATTMDDAITVAARSAAADRIAGLSVVVTTDTNEEAARIANAVRGILVDAGLVEEAGVPLGLTGSIAGVGDEVMTRLNDYDLEVINRDTWRVVGVNEDGAMTVADRDGVVHELPAEYVSEHLQLAYGSTVHAAQGGTWDRALWVTDGRGDAYVPMTRGRERNTAVVAMQPRSQERAPYVVEQDPNLTARSVLEAGLSRDAVTRAARVEQEAEEARLSSMHLISDRIEHVTQLALRARLEDDLDRLTQDGALSADDRARLASDTSTEHLSRVVRAAEQAGLDSALVLREAVQERSLHDARNPAQVLAHRISSAHDITLAIPGQVQPERLPEEHAHYIQQWQELAAERTAELGTKAAQEAPAWAVRALGPVPDDAMERLEWEGRAGRVSAYREATGFSDERRAIPSAPGLSQTEQRASWWGAWEALGRPSETRSEAALSDGQLRVRVTAWEREQQWAPAHADGALREAELKAEDARREAILTRAAGDEEAAAHLAEDADRQASVARGMTAVADARATWAANVALTREQAERAAVELADRGLEPGHEDDRVSAEEWLAEDRRAVELEDEHRAVTELDLDPAVGEDYEAGRALAADEPVWENVKPAETGEAATRSPAHDRAAKDVGDLELESLLTAAREAEARAADRASEEAAHEQVEDEAQAEADGGPWSVSVASVDAEVGYMD